MPEKKYLIEIPGMPDGSGIWDADKWERNKDSFMQDYPDANVFELGEYDAEDALESDQIMLSFEGDEESSGIWDSAKWERNKDAFLQDYPDARVDRVRYVDYWGDAAERNRVRREELSQPDAERDARLAAIGYFDDLSGEQKQFDLNNPSAMGLKPLSSVIKQNSVSGATEYLDPKVAEFYANDTAYTERLAERARLDAEYEQNPSVIAQREWEAKVLAERKAYAGKLQEQIKADMESYVDKSKFAMGFAKKNIPGTATAYATSGNLGKDALAERMEAEKFERYTTADKLLEKAKIARDVAGKGFGGAVVDWAKEGFMDKTTQSDIEAYNEIGNILSRIEKEVGSLNAENITEDVFDKLLSKDEQALIKAFFEYNSAMADAQQDMSRAYKGGKIFAESVPFMLEFLATGGLYKAAGRAATRGLERALVSWISKSARNTAARTAKKVVTAATRDALFALAGTTARTLVTPGTYNRMAEASVEIDQETGELNRVKNATIAAADMYVENLSEISGGLIGKGIGLLGKGAGKLIAKTPLSKIGEMVSDNRLMQSISGFMPKLEVLGFNGLPEEIGEEFIGNAIREVTGIQPGALKEMVADDNFGAMLIGFAPMTLLGAAGGAVNLAIVNAKAAQLGKDMRERFADRYSAEELDHMMGAMHEAQNAEEIQQALKPMALAIADSLEKGMITAEEASAELEMLYQYGGFVAQNNALLFGKKAQDRQLMDAKREEFTGQYGRFWQEDESETVQIATLNNGNTVFVTSTPAEDGMVATVDVLTGKKGFANTSDIATEEVEGEEVQSSNSMTIDAFLNGQIAMQRKTAEETRMTNERNAQIEALRSQITPGTKINLGTEGSPVFVFAKGTNKQGVVIVDETGMESTLGWEQAADAMGQPIIVETDQQKLDEEISARLQRMAERRMKRAVPSPTEQATIEAAEQEAEIVEQEQRHIPRKADGSVDQTALWNENPERWAEWNDEQRQDGGLNSLAYINGAIAKESARIAEMQAGYDAISDFDERDAVEREVAAIRERLQRLVNLRDRYVALAEAVQVAAEEVAQEPQTEEERREPLRQRAKELADKLGVKVNIAESLSDVKEEQAREQILRIDVSGSKERATGWYNPASGEVTIYLPHTADAREIERTIVHEVVAHKGLRGLLGTEGFNVLCDSVWDMMSEEDRLKYMAYPGVNGDKRAAADEYIAHYAETLDLEESKPVWDRIMDLIMRILNSIGVNIQMTKEQLSDIIVASYQKLIQEAAKSVPVESVTEQESITGEGAEVISEDEEEVEQPTAEEVLDENGFEVDEQNEDVRFSVRYLPTPEQRALLVDNIVEQTGRTREDAERWLESELSLAAIVLNDKEYLDYAPDAKYKAIKDNSDYPQGTVDFNNICRKRKDFTRMYTRLQRAYPNRIFTAEDLADIRTIMSEDGLVVACGLCYVEDRRQKLGEVADEFIKDLQDGFKAYGKKNATKRANAEKFASLVGEDTYVPSIYDLITLEGSDRLHDEHRGIWEAFGAYNRARGQQTQNTFQGYAEYKREILTWSDAKVKKVNSLGGLRIFSYSDFEAHHLLDIIQIIIDCAARGVMIQGYTKVPEFARVVEKTGIKLNRSLIPLGDTGIVDGKLAYDPVEGIDINDPNFLESNDNVGNILIGINDEQIRMAMADPFIHYIIPYHARQAGNIRAKLNVGAWTNYIDTQNERKKSDGKRVEKNINIYTEVLNESITNDREFVEKYLEVCREKGYIPKFDQFLDRDAEGNYAYTPGYYKFLVDFKLFDEAGNILPQKPVIAEFDDAFNAQVLLDYAREERETAGEAMNSTYDKIVETLDLGEPTVGEDVRFSVKDSEGPIDLVEEARKADLRHRITAGETLVPGHKKGQPMLSDAEMMADVSFRITKNTKSTIETWFNKAGIDDELTQSTINYLDSAFKDATEQLCAAKWYLGGKINLPGEDDYKVRDAVKVAKKNKVDALLYDSPMDIIYQFGKPNEKQKPINPDNVSTLKNRTEVPGTDIVIYDVEESEESRENMREIINTHYGKNASPWCLLQGNEFGQLTPEAKDRWEYYNAYPKQVAFKGGRLLAFSANSAKEVAWWDRLDKPFEGVPVMEKLNDAQNRRATSVINPKTGKQIRIADVHQRTEKDGYAIIRNWDSVDGPMINAQKRKGDALIAQFNRYTEEDFATNLQYWFAGRPNGLDQVYTQEKTISFRPNGELETYYVEGYRLSYNRFGSATWLITTRTPVIQEYGFNRKGKLVSFFSGTELIMNRKRLAEVEVPDEYKALVSRNPKSFMAEAEQLIIEAGLAEAYEESLVRFRFTPRTDEQREQLFDKAKAHYGLTNNFNASGYMLPDGSLLDFSEANDGGDPNRRSLDHRDIEGLIMDEGKEYDSRYHYVVDFVDEGAIRMLPEAAGFQLSVPPTAEQRSRLMDYIYKHNGEVIMEITDENGSPKVYMEYNKRTSPSRIFKDMDGYFNDGIVPEQTSDLRFSIIGERGAMNDKTQEGLARLANLDVARQMESELNPDWSAKNDENALKIKVATGWERGADGKWRYEVDDIRIKPAKDWIESKKKLSLKDIVENHQIFDIYPDLLDIKIVKDRSKYNLGAMYTNSANEMKLPIGALKDEYRMMMNYYGEEQTEGNFANYWKVMESDIIHELQHAIQHREGFAKGGSPSGMLPEDWNTYNQMYNEMSALIDEYNNIPRYDRLMAWAVDKRREAERAQSRVNSFYRRHRFGEERYRRLAGEVEAYNTKNRRDMSPEERRNTLLASTEDVARKDQIFLMNAVDSVESSIRFRVAFDSANSELNSEGVSINNPALMEEYGLSDITLTKKGNYVTLSKVVVADKGNGNGTRFMEDLTQVADENGWTLVLTPDTSFGASSVTRLKRFYKRFGFKDNRGRNADFSTRESMVRTPSAEVRFRMSNENQAIFVSNAARAVEGIKQEKATPEQWLKMIEKNGGLKAGEDKWMGLSDWLKASDKKTLTKAEVLDYINENMIIIEEQHYAELGEFAASDRLDNEYPGWEDGFSIEWDGYMEEPHGEIRDNEAAVSVYNEHHEKKIELDEDGEFVHTEDLLDVEAFAQELAEIYYGKDSNIREIHGTRLNLTTSGLTNHREIALTIPAIEPWKGSLPELHFADAGEGRAIAWIRFGETYISESTEEANTATENLEAFEEEISQKYNLDFEEAIGEMTSEEAKVHMQLQAIENEAWEQTTRKILVIDEIQSQRHQEGREKGYRSKDYWKRRTDYLAARTMHDGLYEEMKEKYGDDWINADTEGDVKRLVTEEEFARLVRANEEFDAAADAYKGMVNAIPDAPFDKNWHELAMKRMLRYAAENGYDVIAWTKGEQQAERYGIGKVVSSVVYRRAEDGKRVRVNMRGGESLLFDIDILGNVTEVHRDGGVVTKGMALSEIVGTDLAKQIENYEGEVDDRGDYNIKSEDFRIGGEGMKGFYDKMLPAFMNKYGKKWGVKVEDIELPNLEDGLTMHSVPVTEEMKASVMEGQVMFRVRGENESAMDFYQSELDAYKAKYVELGEIKVYPINQETADEFGYTLEELENMGGLHVDDENLIAIFVHEDATNGAVVENAIFHEDIHYLAEFYPYMNNLGGWIWENAEIFQPFVDLKTYIEAEYDEDSYHKEMLAYAVSNALSSGDTGFLESIIPGEYHNIVRQIEKEIGYDRRAEESNRGDGTKLSDTGDAVNYRVSEAEGLQEREESAEETRFRSTEITPEVRDEMNAIAATAIVNGNYMKAPNGKDSNLTAEQWAMVRTKNFKSWFGDWENDPENASKVVDENGEPMVVYHGTAGVINSFEDQQRSPGFWFVDREDVANGYAESASVEFGEGKNVIPVFLNIRNPRTEDAHGEYPAEFALKSYVENDHGVYQEFDTYEEAEAYRKENVPDGWVGASKVGDQHDLVERARELGNDGVIMKDMHDQAMYAETRVKGTQTNYVVFEPSQIKSATDNTGEFSQNFDIRYRVNENPTEAQKEAGNYKKGHLNLDGYRITIENPKGSVRRGTDSKGNAWENTLNNDYGYIRGTEGVDGDHIDVYLSGNPSEGNVFVVDQVNPQTREFDEHKVMYGFNSAEEAREAYLANFSEGWNGLGTITEVSKDEFKKWIESSHRKTKPFSEYKSVKTIGAQSEGEEIEDNLLPSTGTPTEDVVAEGVSLSPAQLASLSGDIFSALPEDSRKKITDGLNGNILNLQDAILQIPTSLATKEEWNDEDKELASVVREKVQDMVDAKGVTSRPLTTKEALWMLYDAISPVTDLVSAASRALVAHNLGFDPASMQRKKEEDDYIRFSIANQGVIDAATDMYNYETSLWTERLKESWFDMNQSVVALQNAMADASGMPIEPWENIVYALNRLSSKSYAAKKKYLRDFLKPLWDAVIRIVKSTDFKIEDIERYMMLKHALERNMVFAKRDAREFYRGMFDEVARKMKSQSHAEQVVELSEAKKALADIDAQIATATGAKLQRLQDERINALYRVEVANLVLRGDEKQNEDDLKNYYDAIDAELDPKYLEFREKDYGGLTSMYTSYGTVNRSKYKSEEAYQKAVLAMQQPIYDNVADMESAARMEVDRYEQNMSPEARTNLWDKVNAATKETLRHQYESGMLTIEQYEAVRDMFKFYIPLRGFADNTAEDMYSYYMNNSSNGFSMPVIGAKGRTTRAESPLGWIGTMAESAIQADNKNEAKMSLYYAVMRRPNQNLLSITETWFEYTGKKDANGKKIYAPAYPPATTKALNADELRQHMEDWEDDMKKKQASGNAFKGTQSVNLRGSVIFQEDKQEKEHVIRVKVAGKDYSILVNGNPRAAQAINGLLNPDANVSPVMEWIGWARRGLSSLLTSYSPLFWIANYQRDLLSSAMRISEADGWGEAMRYLNNRRKAWRVASYVYKNENGTLGDTYYENLYKEFVDNGGVTGYTALTTNKEYEKLLTDYANEAKRPSLIKWGKKVFANFMSFGEAIEQVSRFAAYITAREAGKPIEEAVNAAKEVSVNFNRKGSTNPISREELEKLRTKSGKKLNGVQKAVAVVLSAMPMGLKELYFFFNASVQAITSSIKLAAKSPGKAATWAGAYFGMSIAMAMLNYLLAGDDDDEYLDLPDYLRHSTILIKVGDEYYIKWSIPQEMRPFYAWADMIVSKMMGKMPHKILGKEMALAAAQWLPVNPFEAEDPLLSLVPDVASPIVEAATNKTSFGGKIYDDMAFKSEGTVKDIPAYRKATDKTGKMYVELSEILNTISGGDEVQKGWANVNPAALEHIVEGYGGGIYDFAKMMVALPGMVIDASTGEEEMEIKNIPFVNKVVMSVDETNMYSHTNDAFYHYKKIAESAKRIEKEYAESDNPERAEAYRQEEDWRIYLLYKEYEADFKDVKERIDNAVDDTETDLLKQEQNVLREMFLNDIAKGELPEITFQIREDVKRIDKEIKAIMKPVNDANKERLERKNAGDVDGMLKAIEKRDSLKETPEYRRAEEINEDLKEIKKQMSELGTMERSSQRDSVLGELQKKYDALIEKMKE